MLPVALRFYSQLALQCQEHIKVYRYFRVNKYALISRLLPQIIADTGQFMLAEPAQPFTVGSTSHVVMSMFTQHNAPNVHIFAFA